MFIISHHSLFLLSTFFAILGLVNAIQGDSWCGRSVCIHAYVNGSEWTYQMEAALGEDRLGWLAVGFGSSMSNSPMVIMWPNRNGSVTLSQRTAVGHSEPVVVTSPPRTATTYLPLSSQNIERTQLAFTIPSNSELQHSLIWAVATIRPPTGTIHAELTQHVSSGSIQFDLTREIQAPEVLQTVVPTGPPTGTGTSRPTMTSVPGLPVFELPPLLPYQKVLMAHAVLSGIGFLIILPIGALIGRLGRTYSSHWFKLHWAFQGLIAGPIITAGWSLAVVGVNKKEGIHFNDTHKVVGLVLFGVYILQLLFGLHIHLFKPKVAPRAIPLSAVTNSGKKYSFTQLITTSPRPKQNYFHAIVGISIIGVAFWDVYLGLVVEWERATGRGQAPKAVKYAWKAWVVALPLVYICGLALLPKQLSQERRSTQSKIRGSDALPLKSSPPGPKKTLRGVKISRPIPIKEEEEWKREPENYHNDAVSDDVHAVHSMQPVRFATMF